MLASTSPLDTDLDWVRYTQDLRPCLTRLDPHREVGLIIVGRADME